jgi:hypothetical protein
VALPASLFTAAEFPQRAPLGSSSFSLGEESSGALAVAARWSPAGLGAHGRCALAVLTSNLLLSVWAPVRAPAGSGASWERVAVGNRAGEREWGGDEACPEMKRFQRVRCFAWAPLLGGLEPADEEFLVAVANDDMDVLVVEVRSPHSRLWTGGSWDVAVRCRINIASSDQLRPNLDWTFEDYVRNPNHVAQLAWSPWVAGGGETVVSLIACATGEGIEFVRAVRQVPDSSISLEKVDSTVPAATEHAPGGPLKFDSVAAANAVTLVADLGDELVSCVIDVTDPARMTVNRIPRQEWGEMAGKQPSRDKQR